MKEVTYGYCRVSTKKQKAGRQIDNIKHFSPDAVIIEEAYTGTSMDRPKWKSLLKKVHKGDTIVFDEISRMSRTAEEGFQAYKDLYEKGVHLVFLKERTLDTENFRKAEQIALTGGDVDLILEGVNKYLMVLAENQIKAAFESAQAEVDYLHKRTSEGVRRAIAEGKPVGAKPGKKITTKKSKEMKELIRQLSADFEGTFSDKWIIEHHSKEISRNTYYKYKREMFEEMNKND